MKGHSLILEFDRSNRQFALGFEMGRLWAILSETPEKYDAEVHAANAEMILRLAEATGRTVRTAEIGDGWLTAYFSRPTEVEDAIDDLGHWRMP